MKGAPGKVQLAKQPLLGRRIVVTRERSKSASFAGRLRALGAEAIEFPTIEIVAPDSYEVLDRAIADLAAFDWIIFTSATGVERFIARLNALGHDLRELGAVSIAAIGPATEARLRECGLKVTATPGEYRAEAIAEVIGMERIHARRFLIPRAQAAREALPEMLREQGAREVIVAPTYRTVRPQGAPVDRMRELVAAGAIDLVTFTSSSTVNNFCELIGAPARGLKAAAIGPITAATARERGFEVVLSPAQYTIAALTGAIAEYFRASAN